MGWHRRSTHKVARSTAGRYKTGGAPECMKGRERRAGEGRATGMRDGGGGGEGVCKGRGRRGRGDLWG